MKYRIKMVEYERGSTSYFPQWKRIWWRNFYKNTRLYAGEWHSSVKVFHSRSSAEEYLDKYLEDEKLRNARATVSYTEGVSYVPKAPKPK